MIPVAALVLASVAWTDAYALRLPSPATSGLVRLEVPSGLDPGAAGDYASLRILDADGNETAYALDPHPEASAGRAVTVSDLGFVPGRYTQAVADLGAAGAAHDAIAVDAPVPTYFARVEVAASDDRRTWSVLRDDATIWRVNGDDARGNATVAYPVSHARYVRVRVFATERFPMTSVHVTDADRATDRPTLAAVASGAPRPADAAHVQTWETDAPSPHAAVTAVELATGTPAFARTLVVESSADGKAFDEAGRGTPARFAHGEPALYVAFPERRARRWRVRIENGGDAPLANVRLRLLGPTHAVVFEAAPGQRYRLVGGEPTTPAVHYDLSERLAHDRTPIVATALAGAHETQAPRVVGPWTERHPGIVVATVLLAALVLVASSLRTMRSLRPDT